MSDTPLPAEPPTHPAPATIGAPPPAVAVPAGWYPHPSTSQQTWWDGSQWTEHIAPTAPAGATAAVAKPVASPLAILAFVTGILAFLTGLVPVLGLVLALGAGALAVIGLMKKWPPRWMPLVGAILAGLALITNIGVIAALAGGGNGPNAADPRPNVTREATTSEPTPEVEMVSVPVDLISMTANDASNALAAVGLKAVYDGEPTAKVLSINPDAAEVEAGSTITLIIEQPPTLTLAQKNAIGSAESYLDYSSFSRAGLIGQLEYEGYSTADATFAVDFVNADWNEQAGLTAESYLSYSSFSRQGLYDQLIYEGFTPEQANAGLAAVGY